MCVFLPFPQKWILGRYQRFGSPEDNLKVSCESELLEFPGKTSRGVKEWAREMMTAQHGFSITLSAERNLGFVQGRTLMAVWPHLPAVLVVRKESGASIPLHVCRW